MAGEREVGVAWKIMEIRRDDRCAGCGVELPAGSTAVWFGAERRVRCVECAASHVDPDPSAPATPPAMPPIPSPTPTPPTSAAAPSVPVRRPAPPPARRRDLAAGETVQRWADRSAARDERRDRSRVEAYEAKQVENLQRHRFTGKLLNRMMEPPRVDGPSSSTKAKQRGAEGERRVGAALAGVRGIQVIYSRLQPGKPKADIDCIVVAPTGVWVIDAKMYKGKIDDRNAGGLFRPDWRLTIGGRDKTDLVWKVHEQVESVSSVLIGPFAAVPLRGVLCFADGNFGWPRMAFSVEGVAIVWPGKLAELVSARGKFRSMVPALADHLRSVLKPAG